ncbi:hypothetical protein A3B18_03215 [Candidatus Giovannonibacteria bacterium RIFCSPLOWO2_01_FULL_46_13]|uniref:HEPN domain-containing protein n=2 Tax=Parcubacteria group TaxID=1794811 RepID=A0A1F5X365_9BACT|nr:MAG: hypothetical protein A3B18_03215 [Candidatus Giovannonibacteria bacterium RIFCSPLOWO2_01_FULL_46_13]
MTNKEKYKYAYALTSMASTGLSFVEDSLNNMMRDTTDLSRLRSFYILISYNFELILKSRIVMVENFTDKHSLNDRLIKLGHGIQAIAEALGNAGLQEVGISKVEKSSAQYKISTTHYQEILIEDFIKIRYDFLDDITHTVDSQEHERIKKYMDSLFLILRKVKEKNDEAKNGHGAQIE